MLGVKLPDFNTGIHPQSNKFDGGMNKMGNLNLMTALNTMSMIRDSGSLKI